MTTRLASHLDEAVESIADIERTADEDVSHHQRWIERVTRWIGRPRMVYIAVLAIAGWIAINLLLIAAHRTPFDPPPFPWLEGAVSVTALLMTILILTAENRLSQIEVRRNRLDLQINLLTERKVAKVIDMLDVLRRDLPSIPTHHDPEVHQLRARVDPADVMEAMEAKIARPEENDRKEE